MQTFLADVCNFKSENKRIKFYFVPMEKKFSARITIAHMGIIALKGTHSIVLDRANMLQKVSFLSNTFWLYQQRGQIWPILALSLTLDVWKSNKFCPCPMWLYFLVEWFNFWDQSFIRSKFMGKWLFKKLLQTTVLLLHFFQLSTQKFCSTKRIFLSNLYKCHMKKKLLF